LISTKDFDQKDIFIKANLIADQEIIRALKLKLNKNLSWKF